MCAGCLKVYKTKQGLDRHRPGCLENLAKATVDDVTVEESTKGARMPALPPKRDCFVEAIACDAEYSDAYAGLALTLTRSED